MANNVNVLAVDISAVDDEVFALLERAGRPDADPEGYVAEEAEERVLGGIDGVRWIVQFPSLWALLKDLDARIAAHVEDEDLRDALTEEQAGRTPSQAEPRTALLALGTWEVYDRREMLILADAIDGATAEDQEWADDQSGLGPEWTRLADSVRDASENAFVWTYWY